MTSLSLSKHRRMTPPHGVLRGGVAVASASSDMPADMPADNDLSIAALSAIPDTVERTEDHTSHRRSEPFSPTGSPTGSSLGSPNFSQTGGREPTAAGLAQQMQDTLALHDRQMCQIGSDLHDGPAQLLASALLYMDGLAVADSATGAAAETAVRDAITDALREIRDIMVGVVLPELDRRTAAAAVRLAVDTYQRRTGCVVTLDDSGLPTSFEPPKALKDCLYRLVQEGLWNSFKHANGAAQSVAVGLVGAPDYSQLTVVVKVRDHQPENRREVCKAGHHTNDLPRRDAMSTGLGLTGLRQRIEALDGTFEIRTTASGTELLARFAVTDTSI